MTGLLTKLLPYLRRWRQRRDALHELRRLDDRTLRDIGLNRSEIAAVVETALNGADLSPAFSRRDTIVMTAPAIEEIDAAANQNDRAPTMRPAA